MNAHEGVSSYPSPLVRVMLNITWLQSCALARKSSLAYADLYLARSTLVPWRICTPRLPVHLSQVPFAPNYAFSARPESRYPSLPPSTVL